MELEIWTEKYRPQDFSEVVGQDEIVSRIREMVKSKNIPHLLFAGPPGTGKTTLALIIAKKLFKEKWKENLLELNASVTPDTPIMIKRKGKIERTTMGKLAETYFKDSSKYAFPRGVEILSIDRNFKVKFLPIKNISRHKVNRIARIKYEGGEIKATLSHSVIVLDDNCNLKSVAVGDLKEGDLLISFKTTIEGNEEDLHIMRFAPKEFVEIKSKGSKKKFRNPTVKTILRKLKVNKEIAWLFGDFLAEGCVNFTSSSGSIIFTHCYPKEMNHISRISNIASNLGFSSSAHIIRSGSSGKFSGIQLTIPSTQLARFFKEFFYQPNGKEKAEHKRIPSFVFNWPIELRYSFLKGYMGDATGKWNEYLRYSSKSKNILVDLTWLGRISGLDTSCFERESRIIWKLPSFSYSRDELLPASPLIRFLEEINNKIKFNWKYILRHQLYSKRCKRISKGKFEEIIKRVDELKLSKEERVKLNALKKLVNSDLYFIKIKEIKVEEYDGYVYDVSVPGSEMFFGGSAPILLHNSDERGIDTIRTKVKDFARTKPLGDVPFKIILLDEADALTRDAQQALRRTMENFTATARFILSCNYSSKIIEPIQSRCAIFRFKPLDEKALEKYIKRIAEAEKLKIDEEAIKAIYEVSEGDARRAVNILQACAALSKKIDEDTVYEVSGFAKPQEVKEILQLALNGNFEEAKKRMTSTMIKYGISGIDTVKLIQKYILTLDIPDEVKIKLIETVGDYEFRIVEGGDEFLQIEALLAQFYLIGSSLRKK